MKLLIKSDNIAAMNYLLEKRQLAGKVDLIYTDPPFATNVSFTMGCGRTATISNIRGGEVAYEDKLLGLDFIEFLRQRLELMRQLLSPRGSIYLHTDYKIGHYVRVMMDEVFGIEHFRNDITRVKCNPKNFKRIGFGNVKDMILFYTRGDKPIWHEPKTPYTEDDLERLFPKKDNQGRRYTTVPIHAPGESANPKEFHGKMPPPGRHWRTDVAELERLDREGMIEWSANGNPRRIIYAEGREGKRMQDIWTDYKDPQYPIYPTEKNLDMVKMIISTSSDANSIVLDPFCGSGTTLVAATDLGRQWIGIDRSQLAIDTTRHRLGHNSSDLFGMDYEFVDMG